MNDDVLHPSRNCLSVVQLEHLKEGVLKTGDWTPFFREKIVEVFAQAASAVSETATTVRACRWQQDADGIYQTGCDESFFFETGSAEENKAKFCQYCGGNLIVSNYKEAP